MSAWTKFYIGAFSLAIGAVIVFGMKLGLLPIIWSLGVTAMFFTWGGISICYVATLEHEAMKRARKVKRR